ncbi:MAG: sulfite exporter TauE/SafE family protein, partial [Magnetococcales bacterium]|nr:sulfite exporter TauE/SafE family protein [Magnetococcales bacterium]
MFFVAALATGLAAGIIAGMFGVGGGIIIVPALLFLFAKMGINQDVIMHLAVGTSLATIVVTNISATFNHHRRGSHNGIVAYP